MWIFLGVIIIRTLAFKPHPQKEIKREEISVDEVAVISALQSLIKCKTVSYHDKSLEDEAEFQKLIALQMIQDFALTHLTAHLDCIQRVTQELKMKKLKNFYLNLTESKTVKQNSYAA